MSEITKDCPRVPGCCFWIDGDCIDGHYEVDATGHPRCRAQEPEGDDDV